MTPEPLHRLEQRTCPRCRGEQRTRWDRLLWRWCTQCRGRGRIVVKVSRVPELLKGMHRRG